MIKLNKINYSRYCLPLNQRTWEKYKQHASLVTKQHERT